MASNFPIEPYYDDFDDSKNFQKILFKPSLPVQARELTQLQSILQDQIKKFGDHVFKHGSVVIPGNSFTDLNTSYVKVESTDADLNFLEGKTVTGSSNQVKARIRKAINDAGQIVIYIGYTSGGVNGESLFEDGESLVVDGTGITLTAIEEDSTGVGSMAFINRGVFYIRGSFVTVNAQSTVIDKYSPSPSCRVVLRIVESIITSDDDLTLLDPAQGSYNFAAPGADRHKTELIFESIPLSAEVGDDFVEIMRYNNGVLEEHARYSQYNELEKNLARRTFDESGNYVVTGLTASVREHLKTDLNGGVFPAPEGNQDKFVTEVAPGKAYIQGFEVEKVSTTNLVLDKGRTSQHIKTRGNNAIQPQFGQFFYVSGLKSLPNFAQLTQVTLWNDDDDANGSATQVGTARVMAIDYLEGDPASNNAVYKLYFTDQTYRDWETDRKSTRLNSSH